MMEVILPGCIYWYEVILYQPTKKDKSVYRPKPYRVPCKCIGSQIVSDHALIQFTNPASGEQEQKVVKKQHLYFHP